MLNGPNLWSEILETVRNIGGQNPIIAGGAIRDYVLNLGQPKDIDVFIGGSPPDGMQLDPVWLPLIPPAVEGNGVQPEYHGQMGTITAIQDWHPNFSDRPVQFIWIGNNDPVNYVRGFDLGTSKCYYRGSVVLGKDFLNDWHNNEITILESAFQLGRNIDRSRERAGNLERRFIDTGLPVPRIVEVGFRIDIEADPLWPAFGARAQNVPEQHQGLGQQDGIQEFWNGHEWPRVIQHVEVQQQNNMPMNEQAAGALHNELMQWGFRGRPL